MQDDTVCLVGLQTGPGLAGGGPWAQLTLGH